MHTMIAPFCPRFDGLHTMIAPLYTLSSTEIADFLRDAGQPAFRRKQLFEWVFVRGAKTYDEMTNLPASLRTMLAEELPKEVIQGVLGHSSIVTTERYINLLRPKAAAAAAIGAFNARDTRAKATA